MGQMVGNPKVTVIPARPRMGIGRKTMKDKRSVWLLTAVSLRTVMSRPQVMKRRLSITRHLSKESRLGICRDIRG